MIVYHGSIKVVKNPDVVHSYRNLDFGRGFYVTTVKEQAERWARRKADLADVSTGVVSVYEMTQQANSFAIIYFDDNLDNWIDFVCDCRNGGEDYKNYDIISGKVANDKVYRVVDMYRRGIWDKERAIKEVKAYEAYDQIAFISQKAIDELLCYMDSYEVKVND